MIIRRFLLQQIYMPYSSLISISGHQSGLDTVITSFLVMILVRSVTALPQHTLQKNRFKLHGQTRQLFGISIPLISTLIPYPSNLQYVLLFLTASCSCCCTLRMLGPSRTPSCYSPISAVVCRSDQHASCRRSSDTEKS